MGNGKCRSLEMSEIIVFATGCFDLFHAGHLSFLEQAKALGDKLIVGVHTDEWIEESKGIEPILPLCHRLRVISGLKCVDVAFPIAGPKDEKGAVLLGATIRAVGLDHGYLPGHGPLQRKMEKAGIKYIIVPKMLDISSTKMRRKCYEQIKNRKDLITRLDNLRHVVSGNKRGPGDR